jgi:hypothetical protein
VKYVILTFYSDGTTGTIVGPFDSKKAAGEYAERHKGNANTEIVYPEHSFGKTLRSCLLVQGMTQPVD